MSAALTDIGTLPQRNEEPFDAELERLEGRPVAEPHWRAKMWRRSYCVALNAIAVLEQRVRHLRREQWDTPMVFFYPSTKEGAQ